jgi:type II secretory pathway component PulL
LITVRRNAIFIVLQIISVQRIRYLQRTHYQKQKKQRRAQSQSVRLNQNRGNIKKIESLVQNYVELRKKKF